jgi:hypothetical protein
MNPLVALARMSAADDSTEHDRNYDVMGRNTEARP